MNNQLSHGGQLHARLIGSVRAKNTSLYEMLEVPTKSDCHSRQYGDLQCNSNNFGYGDYDNRNDTPTVEAMNGASVKTPIMAMNVCQNKISREGTVYTVQDKEMQLWIGRWRHRCTQTTERKDKHPSPTQCSPEYSEPEIYEKKQIPSIAAMALMAKVVNKRQKCELQKRGSSTVWKAEGL